MEKQNYQTPQLDIVTFWGTAICYESTKGAGSISAGQSVDWGWTPENNNG